MIRKIPLYRQHDFGGGFDRHIDLISPNIDFARKYCKMHYGLYPEEVFESAYKEKAGRTERYRLRYAEQKKQVCQERLEEELEPYMQPHWFPIGYGEDAVYMKVMNSIFDRGSITGFLKINKRDNAYWSIGPGCPSDSGYTYFGDSINGIALIICGQLNAVLEWKGSHIIKSTANNSMSFMYLEPGDIFTVQGKERTLILANMFGEPKLLSKEKCDDMMDMVAAMSREVYLETSLNIEKKHDKRMERVKRFFDHRIGFKW